MSIRQLEKPSIADVMLPTEKFPIVGSMAMLKSALDAMAKAKLGVVCIVDDDGKLAGVFTDGDIRRQLLQFQKPFSALFADDIVDHMTREPLTVHVSDDLNSAIDLMESKQVWDLPVVDDDGKLIGLLHLHPVVKALLG